jgi:hypothetical protein
VGARNKPCCCFVFAANDRCDTTGVLQGVLEGYCKGFPGSNSSARAFRQREKKFVHMLNGTLCATERALCCLVETHQTPDGINIPEAFSRLRASALSRPTYQPGHRACASCVRIVHVRF